MDGHAIYSEAFHFLRVCCLCRYCTETAWNVEEDTYTVESCSSWPDSSDLTTSEIIYHLHLPGHSFSQL